MPLTKAGAEFNVTVLSEPQPTSVETAITPSALAMPLSGEVNRIFFKIILFELCGSPQRVLERMPCRFSIHELTNLSCSLPFVDMKTTTATTSYLCLRFCDDVGSLRCCRIVGCEPTARYKMTGRSMR